LSYLNDVLTIESSGLRLRPLRKLRKARRCGVWSDEPKPGKAIALAKPRAAAAFARVAVSDMPARSSMLLRLLLTNGRRAELEIGGVAQLCEVLDVLERRA
jgi:hypothetical protein